MPFRSNSKILLIALLSGALAASCGSSSTTMDPLDPPETDDNPFDGSGIVGPAGGQVSLAQGISIDIPAGSLPEDTRITISAVATPADLQAAGAIGQAYRIAPVDLTLSPAGRVAIFVPDAAIAGRPLAALTILRSTSGGADLVPAAGRGLVGADEELGNVQRTGGAMVSGTTTNLGTFSVAATEPPNRAPTANAGPDQSADTGDVVAVNGSGSDPDGDPLTFSWAFQSRPAGSAATLTNANAASASFTPDVAGDYVLVLTVDDGNGGTDTDTVTVTATDPPANQVNANAGPDQSAQVGQVVNLDGRGSTGMNLSYSWRFVSTPGGGTPTIQGVTTAQASFTPNAAGDYLVELTVTDGATADRDTVRISVIQPNRAPSVSLSGPNAVLLGSQATITASTSDPDGDPVTLQFSLQTPGGSSASLQVNGNQASFTPDVPGTYTVRATASDGTVQTTANAGVSGNVNVAGTYDTTFATTSVNGCGDFVTPGSTTAPMQVLQNPGNPGQVTLNLTEVTDNIESNPTGTLQGTQFNFNGGVVVGDGSQSVTANGNFSGTFTQGGAMDLAFNFSVLTCTVTGTITGQKQ